MDSRFTLWRRSILLLLLLPFSLFAQPTIEWVKQNSDGSQSVTLYFFWSETCPHCAEAHPFIDKLPERFPWIRLESHRVQDSGTIELLQSVAAETSVAASSVPYFASCGNASVGYSGESITGQFLLKQLASCYQHNGGQLSQQALSEINSVAIDADAPLLFETCDDGGSGAGTCGLSTLPTQPAVQPVELPFIGVVAPEQMSLPLLTVVLGGVDAFNPCAFFVLLFLLSIMVNAKSRSRMLIVGGIFVFFSGAIYFMFMSAWLNIFELLGGSDGGWIMMAAGAMALTAGAINMKEYFTTKGEVSLSMSAENRTGLIKRMGQLTKASSMPTMIAGTVVLSILANAYELLCTAGFPMIYTSVLTMHDLPDTTRYLYLLFYNVVYVIPLLAIVIVFAMTMGKRKLTEKEGQTLKLLSGIMMMGMGTMLVIDPTALQQASLAIGLIFGSMVVTAIIALIRNWRERRMA
ncbi:cytochrome C biosynthesis protein [Ferrimonas lipolytica]|uniref:Cytochrome C biosynthesis protein n=1 Tax=Ferrimonas lipolytica TaxID=2724191 RepID=A0A6H1UJN1_9GAMM|nr:cytochrome C biosynthesis protein [Ferrimonas lipolytica]QIZ78426.1 cytochrome C biosynthesis protein [Ferrimonas lipolytica]